MSETAINPSDPPIDDDELLVAYLDHELPSDQVQALEDRLTHQSGLRRRLVQLQTSWEMLGDLDDQPPNRDLVSSTMELVVMDLTSSIPVADRQESLFDSSGNDAETEAIAPVTDGRSRSVGRDGVAKKTILGSPIRRGIGLFLIAVLVGSIGARWINHRQQRSTFERLSVAQHFEALRAAPNVAMIRHLAARDDWQTLIEAMPKSESAAMEATDLRAAEKSNFDALTANWNDSDRGILASRFERFSRLKPDDIGRLRGVAERFEAAEDYPVLTRNLDAYARWRETLSVEDQQELDHLASAAANLDDDDALNTFLDSAIEKSMQSLSKRSVVWLSDDATDSIESSLRVIVSSRIDLGDPLVTPIYQIALSMKRWNDPLVPTLIRLFVPDPQWVSGQVADAGLAEFELSASEQDFLVDALPDEAFAQLDRLTAGDPISEQLVLRIWSEEAVRRSLVSTAQMSNRQRYLKLSEEERRRINLLPPDQFYERLTQQDSLAQ